MPTGKRNNLFKVLEKYFDADEASGLADYLQNTCSAQSELKVEEVDGGFLVLLDDEAIIQTLTRGEAALVCADIKWALES